MKTYPHQPDLEDMRDIEQRRTNRYAKIMAAMKQNLEAKNELWMELGAEDSIDLASISYGFGNPPAAALGHLRNAARHAAKALEFGLRLSPYQFLLLLAVGLIVEDDALVKTLSGFARKRFTNPEEDAPEAGYLLAEAAADLAGGRTREAAERLEKAVAAPAKMNRFQKAEFGDLIQMAGAIVRNDQTAWNKAAAAREKSYAKTYSRPDYQQFPEGLLDLRALGLARLAKAAGLAISESVYVPASLLEK